MDWDDFFEKTRVAAGVESFSKLAPKLGVTDGAIGHYRRGRQIPSVWVVADALRIQKHPNPEIAAVEIMRNEARTSSERTFWKRLAATAMALALGVGFASPRDVQAAMGGFDAAPSIHYAKGRIGPFPGSWAPAGAGSSSGSALASPLVPPTRTRSKHERIDLTGPWAGFGFQGGHIFTPEEHSLEQCDMTWWSLTCNITREWRLMMEEARPRQARSLAAGKGCATMDSSVVYLREYVRIRRERRLGVGDPGAGADR